MEIAMHYRRLAVLIGAVFMFTGPAWANAIAVNNAAAMGSSNGTACGGSDCGMDVTHDNASMAFVQDNSPNNETVYRAEFLFNPVAVSATVNFRQPIFTALARVPNPGAGLCPANLVFTEAIRCFHYRVFGGTTDALTCFVKGNALVGYAAVGGESVAGQQD